MTDNEIIIKALMSQADNMLSAVVDEKRKTHFVTNEDVANFINRQNEEIDILIRKKNDLQDEIAELQAKNERLTAIVEAAEDYLNPLPFKNAYDEAIDKAKSEAIKEFAERLKERADRGF